MIEEQQEDGIHVNIKWIRKTLERLEIKLDATNKDQYEKINSNTARVKLLLCGAVVLIPAVGYLYKYLLGGG